MRFVRKLRLAAVGAALMYFFDPQDGRRRRNMARDRVLAFFRERGRQAARAGRAVSTEAYGAKQKVTHLKEEPKEFDDATLANKVRTEIFRPADAPKGDVNINVEDGVVYLRGEVERPELIDDLVDRARNVQGVQGVENLLHLPGTEAPAKAE
jgi:osmotically-inducible protein OsmY